MSRRPKPPGEKFQLLTISVPPELTAEVDRLAALDGRSRSQTARMLLEAGMKAAAEVGLVRASKGERAKHGGETEREGLHARVSAARTSKPGRMAPTKPVTNKPDRRRAA